MHKNVLLLIIIFMNKEGEKKQKSEVFEKEQKILEFWRENNIFEKSLEKESDQGEFVFYDGPPYGTGAPHYGHFIPGTIKDIIPRYKTMQGYHVPRRWGWDCHGLPVENLIEKNLNLKSKKDIEDFGIGKFNAAARDKVLEYANDWKKLIPLTGRWVDMSTPYRTMDASYMESVWWVFKTLSEKGLVSEGFKAMHICPRCETPLSNFEVNQGYKDVKDISVIAEFELTDEPGTYVLAWTTTPWTLPGNVALAVGVDITYVKIEKKDEGTGKVVRFILAKELLDDVFGADEYITLEELSSSDLVGKSYKPLFDYYSSDEKLENKENGWKIYAADFVTTEEGTGVVHIAPAFGSDDYSLLGKENLPFVQHVTIGGVFKSEVTDFADIKVKEKGSYMDADISIVKWLAHSGKLFSKKKIEHSYPHCWRCDTPLINYATKSWFVDVPSIKDKLLASNTKTKWVPEHLKEGRFGNWLEGAREWAVSRNRYWGTPLPVWENKETGKKIIIGSIAELKEYIPSSQNNYYVMRHGQSESNVLGVVSAYNDKIHPLTDLGKGQVLEASKDLKSKNIDLVFSSPMLRTFETAKILSKELGLKEEEIITDDRLREQGPGDLEGGSWDEYHDLVANLPKEDWFSTPMAGGESYQQVKKRLGSFLYEIEKKYQGKNIAIVTHGGASWLLNVLALEHLPNNQEYKKHNSNLAFVEGFIPFKNAEVRDLPFVSIPHDEDYNLDLHRPYIDDVVLRDKEGKLYKRVEEVFDVWFDSGSMPYGQLHYPFENEQLLKESRFPASFIAEGLDQTRGWFYVLMVLATALFGEPAFKQVVVNGMLLAEDGKKMSKSLNNYPDPLGVLEKYGGDAFRLFIVSLPVVRGESASFSEKGVQEAGSKVMGRLRNMLSFYGLYSNGRHKNAKDSTNVLDLWVLERLNLFNREIQNSLDSYRVDQGARLIFDFVDDLSTWYVRRSRDRFKKDSEDAAFARGVLQHILKESALLIAPYVPFVAEEIWLSLRDNGDKESVHLAKWPEAKSVDEKTLNEMKKVREVVSLALELRAKAGIKVRQPLNSLYVPVLLEEGLLSIIAEEVNVKNVSTDTSRDIALDTELNEDLKKEGSARELVRHIQSLRKKAGLSHGDIISLVVMVNEKGKDVFEVHKEYITESVNSKSIELLKLSEDVDVSCNGADFSVRMAY